MHTVGLQDSEDLALSREVWSRDRGWRQRTNEGGWGEVKVDAGKWVAEGGVGKERRMRTSNKGMF